MPIIIGSARHDENGKYVGGQAGDQLQESSTNDMIGEVSMQAMYKHKKIWLDFRLKDYNQSVQIAKQMIFACNNSNVGYDQGQRKDLWTYVKEHNIKSLDQVVEPVECDCSMLIRVIIYIVTGIDIGDFTTANEPGKLKESKLFEASFEYVSQETTPVYNGDILVTKIKGHTAVVVSGNPRPDRLNNSKNYYSKYTGTSGSIVDALATVGEKDTSKSHRAKIAVANNIVKKTSEYKGSAAQNMSLLSLLKSGKLIKA